MASKRNSNQALSNVRARRRRLFWIRFNIIFFIALILLFTLAILSGHDKIRIKEFLIRGNDSVPTSQILEIAEEATAGRYFGLFARANFLLFPRYTIEKKLLAEIKTIEKVNVSWDGWKIVAIDVKERKPHAVWCEKEALPAKCFFTDETGYIFDEAPNFSGSIFVKSYGALSLPDAEPLGQTFLGKEQYQKIFELVNILADKGIEVFAVSYDGYDFTFSLKIGPKIIFNGEHGGFATSFNNLFLALDTGDLPLLDNPEEINYVDLRFENKVVIGRNK
jgi:hypothetical protein